MLWFQVRYNKFYSIIFTYLILNTIYKYFSDGFRRQNNWADNDAYQQYNPRQFNAHQFNGNRNNNNYGWRF